MRSKSVQDKFMSFFLHDPASQSFFKRVSDYITSHKEKLQKGTLYSFYKTITNANEFSET